MKGWKTDLPTPSQLKHFDLTKRQYKILAKLGLQKSLRLDGLAQEFTGLADRGFLYREHERVRLTPQGEVFLTAVRALIKK